MFELKERGTSATIGALTPEQKRHLIDVFEEETDEDQDYWINRTTLELLREKDSDLAAMIEKAMGDRGDIEVAWVEIPD